MIPFHGWMPETTADPDAVAPAHYVQSGAAIALSRYGYDLVALCGAKAFPIYGSDRTNRMFRHPRCSECEHLHEYGQP